MQKSFSWKDFISSIAVIAIPVALQNLLTTTGSMVDTMMLAPLGETTVGAVGLCAQFASLFFSCYWGFVGGGMLFFSQYHGAGDDRGIDRAYETTMIFMLSVGAIFFALGFFVPDRVMAVYTDKAAIGQIGAEYLHTVAWAYPLQVISMCMSALLRSTERVRIPLVASIASVLTNALCNWIFIYGKLGAPAMGARGAALATVIAAVVNLGVVILTAQLTGYPCLFRFFTHLRLSGRWMSQYLHKCFPILCNELLVGIGFTTCNIVLGRQAEEAIAALAVFRTLEGFVIAFFSGFSNASSVLVGKEVGAGEIDAAYARATRITRLCAACIAAVCAGLFALHGPLLTAMGLSGESFAIARGFLGIYCVAAVIRMCNWTLNDTFRAAGDAARGTVLEIVFMYLMVIPCVCLSGLVFHLPVFFVFGLCYVDEPIRCVLMHTHLFSGKWIKPVTPQGKEALQDFLARRKG